MEEKQSKASLVKEYYAEELNTEIKSLKASDVAGRITKQIKEMLLEENGETVTSLKCSMGQLRRQFDELKDLTREIKETDFTTEAAERFKEAKQFMEHESKAIDEQIRREVSERIKNIRADIMEHLDEQIAARVNSENPFLNEVDGFMAIMKKYEAPQDTISDGLCALLNSLSFVYWKRIEASMENKSKDDFKPYQKKAGRRL